MLDFMRKSNSLSEYENMPFPFTINDCNLWVILYFYNFFYRIYPNRGNYGRKKWKENVNFFPYLVVYEKIKKKKIKLFRNTFFFLVF